MTKKRHSVLWSVVLAAVLAGSIQAQPFRISQVTRLDDGRTQITATGASSSPVAIEGTSDFINWANVASFRANTPSMTAIDPTTGLRNRSYRLRNLGVLPAPTTLSDLAAAPNRVFAPAQATTTIQYAPDGKLAFLAYRDRDLIVRERNTAGGWTESVVNSMGNLFVPLTSFSYSGPRNDFSFQAPAALVYDSQSRLHVFSGTGTTIIHYVKNGGAFSETERIAAPGGDPSIAVIHAVAGANNVIHFATLSSSWTRTLNYGSNRNGSWSWTRIATINDAPLDYWAPPFAPRWLELAVDSRNNGHIVFRPEMITTKHPQGYPRAYSQLWYASNVSGSWTKQMVQQPFDPSGEAANGASIAIAPDDKPRIVSWYNERADTGSAQESRLYFHQQDGAGNWSASIVAQSPDGYAAGDGPKGTGFSPVLKYDNRGRAHILFMDAAGEHFGLPIGQQEYAGNVRHAWWNGSAWSVETVYRQTAPLQEQGVYPTFAMSANEMAVTFVDRKTQWNLSGFPPMANSTYYYRFFTKPLL